MGKPRRPSSPASLSNPPRPLTVPAQRAPFSRRPRTPSIRPAVRPAIYHAQQPTYHLRPSRTGVPVRRPPPPPVPPLSFSAGSHAPPGARRGPAPPVQRRAGRIAPARCARRAGGPSSRQKRAQRRAIAASCTCAARETLRDRRRAGGASGSSARQGAGGALAMACGDRAMPRGGRGGEGVRQGARRAAHSCQRTEWRGGAAQGSRQRPRHLAGAGEAARHGAVALGRGRAAARRQAAEMLDAAFASAFRSGPREARASRGPRALGGLLDLRAALRG